MAQVYCNFAGITACLVTPGRVAYRPGDEVQLLLERERVHLFDPARDGIRLPAQS